MTIKNETHNSPALQQLIKEDAVGQLRRRDGLMAMLGSEDGARAVKMARANLIGSRVWLVC